MEEIVRQTLLFDFYGELLTAHQQKVYEAVVCNDTSYSEVASDMGISRQGVHDLVRRSAKLLDGYEESLHLVEKFLTLQKQVRLIRTEAVAADEEGRSPDTALIIRLADEILEEL